MDQIVDKILLLLCGLSLSLFSSFELEIVVYFLCILIFLTLDEFFQERFPSVSVFCFVIFLSFLLPELSFFLPTVIYPVISKKRSPVVFLFFIPYFYRFFYHPSFEVMVLLLLFFLLSLMLSDRQRKFQLLSRQLNQLRDDDREKQLLLLQQTHTLQESQNNQIKLATLQERTRIAREIHDNVGHLLSRSLIQIGALLTRYKEDASLALLRDSLDSAMNAVRSSVHNLRDEAVDLENSVRLLLDSYQSYHTSFTYEIVGTVPPQITYCFLTILKEALTNISKHSNGDSIQISIKEFSSLYQLLIADNGTNAKAPEETEGMGLNNMRDRVTALNGVLRFSVSDGFHIFVSIPKQ